MLTKKDYVTIAEIIVKVGYKWLYRKRLCNDLTDYFATDNPHFDRSRFMKACGL